MRLLLEEHQNPGLLSGGGAATFVACDTCGQKIQGQEDGIVVFHLDSKGQKTGDFAVIHKGRCETPETQKEQWEDLEIFLRDILLNTKSTWRTPRNASAAQRGLPLGASTRKQRPRPARCSKVTSAVRRFVEGHEASPTAVIRTCRPLDGCHPFGLSLVLRQVAVDAKPAL